MNNYNNWFSLQKEQKKSIFTNVANLTGLPEAAIEKDWWVSFILRFVFSGKYSRDLIFKGGTSLSKGWNLIERFSEDIDISIDRKVFDIKEVPSKSQIKRLRKLSCAFIVESFFPMIRDGLHDINIPDIDVSLQEFEDNDKDPITIEIHYNSIVESKEYLKPRVLIEIGARSLMEPFEIREIASIVDKTYPDKSFASETFKIKTVMPQRTFLEKAFLLHEEFQKQPEQIKTERLTRHLYDLEKLMDTEFEKEALMNYDLYKTIVEHRSIFNALREIDYLNHSPNKINFYPPKEVEKDLKRDYLVMCENMIYGKYLKWEDLLDRINQLLNRFRKIAY